MKQQITPPTTWARTVAIPLVEFLPPPQQMMIVQKTVTPDQVANLAAQVLDSSDLDV